MLIRMLALAMLLIAPVRFRDVTAGSGITFRHRHGGSGEKHIMETLGGGGGFWDYDEDGDLDIYLLNGAPLPGYAGERPLQNALYRNDGGLFRDVSLEAGLREPGYSMGCAMADYDNDGDPDVYVTSFGPNHLYRNNGDGTFTDVTIAAGVGDEGFGAGAAFGDLDGDGNLDLYVTNYLTYSLETALYCGDEERGIRAYCHPDHYPGSADVLYLNRGDGTFADISHEAGVDLSWGKGLGVVWTDQDQDGDPDIYVANDSVMNAFFRNEGRGRLSESGLELGVGFNEEGRSEAGMGVDAADYDLDGRLDLFVTNYERETNTLYRGLADGSFLDTTNASGLAAPSLPWVGFGTGFFDADLDGDPDLYVANGHIMDDPLSLTDATSYPQPNQIFENRGGHFFEISSTSGDHFRELRVSRGAAFGDWENDGDVDLLILNNNDVPNLLSNETVHPNHWLMLRLVGQPSNRNGFGALVRVKAGGPVQIDELRSGTSYLSQNDPRLHFGLGASATAEAIEIRWPSGLIQTLRELPADRIHVVREGHEPQQHP